MAGLWLWGAPDPAFEPVLPLVNLGFIVVVGTPAMAMAAFADGGTAERPGRPPIQARGMWLVSIGLLMWPTSFVHFGGFCLDAEDVCMVRWPSRAAGLLLALGLWAAGWLGATAIAPQRARPPAAAEIPR